MDSTRIILSMENTKVTEVDVEGVNYTVQAVKKKKKKQIRIPEKILCKKFIINLQEQEQEVAALKLLYNERFRIEDEIKKRYSVELFIRGGQDASLQFSFPHEYPSDVPPTYNLTASWVREQKRMALYRDIANIYTENFGKCIMYKWVDKITEVLKKEVEDMKKKPQDVEQPQPVVHVQEPIQEESLPEIYEGKPIWDRGSCFLPFLSKVTSEDEVRKVISKIEDCRKVSTAWRNTYAYRFSAGKDDKIMEIGEDGGEPKAGGNLLKRLISYNAINVLVFISRRFGGSMLGPDRYKHLNDAADNVLIDCGYKNIPLGKKSDKGVGKEHVEQKKKDKKYGKKKK